MPLKEVDRVEILTILDRGPSFLLDDLLMVTGQVPRSTSFEVGLPLHHALIDGSWRPDPYLYDDQAIVVHVRDKGLVVLTKTA